MRHIRIIGHLNYGEKKNFLQLYFTTGPDFSQKVGPVFTLLSSTLMYTLGSPAEILAVQ